ncbi:MAG: transglycosylase domain-containing protein [Chloroflexi bacterium]|nr:transglycosylase domain-containing protein [Chloroflexota bacterium]
MSPSFKNTEPFLMVAFGHSSAVHPRRRGGSRGAPAENDLLRFRRAHRVRGRRPAEAWRLPLVLTIACLSLTAALLAGVTAGLVGADAAITQARRFLTADAIALPRGGRLDANLPQTATITARDGTVLATIDDPHYGQRTYAPLSAISRDLVLATLAAEDRRFFSHSGIDPAGVLRAVGQDARGNDVVSGASTIEMQLVRNLFLADERSEQTLARKLKEAVAAYQMDQRFSKSQLIEAYLNTVYYANQVYGAEAAAQRYFGKPARALTLPEAALLAGIPQSPSDHDPLQHFDQAKERQEQILSLMADAGLITEDQADQARLAPIRLVDPKPIPSRAPHFVNYVQDLVHQQYGPEALFTGGLRIQTSIDLDVQALAEQIVAQNEAVRQAAHANNSAIVVMDPRNGQLLAMVGSKDFWDASISGQVNVALAGRQPGSSIKPLLYLAGFEHGLNPATRVMDQPTAFSAPPGQPPYTPANYENHYFGLVTLRDALGNSLNVPAVKVLKDVGVPALQEMARRLGITTFDSWDPRWLSLTLGGGEVRLLELTGAYATIAREGRRLPIEPLLDIQDSAGNTLHHAQDDPVGEQVVDPRIAYQLLHIMGDPGSRLVTFGPATPLNLDRPHMVKTGTTDDYRDTWTVGCIPQVCVGVWMGNTNNDPMVKVSSSLTAGKIWVDLMHGLINHFGWLPTPWPVPDGVVVRQIPNVGSTRPGSGTHEEVFLAGQEQQILLDMDWRRPF